MLTIFKKAISLPLTMNINYNFSAKAFQAIRDEGIKK
jgi:hypothetical protein